MNDTTVGYSALGNGARDVQQSAMVRFTAQLCPGTRAWLIGLALAALAIPGWHTQARAQNRPRLAVAPNVSTLGFGGDLAFGISNYLAIRAGGHFASLEPRFDDGGIAYHVSLDWRSAQALLDFHPLGNAFRISAGAVWNGNRAKVLAMPTGPISVGNIIHQPADAGRVSGTVGFKTAAPYFGFGVGGGRGLHFTLDLGVVFQGKPRQTYDASTKLTGTWKAMFDHTVQTAATQLQGQINDAMYLRFYPVVSLGMSLPIW